MPRQATALSRGPCSFAPLRYSPPLNASSLSLRTCSEHSTRFRRSLQFAALGLLKLSNDEKRIMDYLC